MLEKNVIKLDKLIINLKGNLSLERYKICTDTRALRNGDIYLALKGLNFDGYRFIHDAVKKGCAGIIYNYSDVREREVSQFDCNNIFFIGTKDTEAYLQEIAKKHILYLRRNKYLKKVIAITGSNGKTTSKDMLFHLLKGLRGKSIHSTKGNFNNHIGLPLTLLETNEHHEFVIVEMGTNYPGEISKLCSIAKPDAGYITNIGDAHLEFLIDRNGIFKEKKILYDVVMKNTNNLGEFIINIDDLYLSTLIKHSNVVSIGEKNNTFKLSALNQQVFLKIASSNFELINNNITGKHNFINLAHAFSMAYCLFPNEHKKLVNLAQTFIPTANRSEWLNVCNAKIYLDAYNANPSSMKASINGFIQECLSRNATFEKILLVLGDMNELGDQEIAKHVELGEMLKNIGVLNAVFVGNKSCYYNDGFSNNGEMFQNVDQLLKIWPKMLKKYNYFFIKGSRTLQLELLADIK